MGDRPLYKVVRSFLERRLILPLAVLAIVAAWGLVGWRVSGLEREHEIIAWGVDNFLTSFLTSADDILRLSAVRIKRIDEVSGTYEWSETIPLYHRIFLVSPDGYTVLTKGNEKLTSHAVAPPPVSYFPETGVWPIYSLPYYRADLESVTIAIMIQGRWGNVIGELNLDHLHRLIAAYLHKVPRRILWITDRYGNVIVHTDERVVKEQENLGHEPLVRKALEHPEGIKLFGRLGATAVYGVSWRIDPWGWVVLVAYPLVPALLPVLGAAAVGFSVFFALLYVVFLGLMGRLNRSVIEPMQVLSREANRLAEGVRAKNDPWPNLKGTFTELVVFSQNFQKMGDSVQEREDALRRRQAELVRAQETLARSESRYRGILESLQEAYFEVGPEGVVIFQNQAFLRLLGLDAPLETAFSIRDMADPEMARAIESFLAEIAAGRELGEFKTFALRDQHGATKMVEISARPMDAEDGLVQGVRILARDVTAKIEAERRAQDLEKIISHAQKMESLGTLASGIAHEFNNLLQAMTGYLDLLEMHTEASDRKRRWIARVREAAERGAELVRRMLTFARQDEITLELVDINGVVGETLDFLSRNIPRIVRLEADLGPDVPALYGDRLQLEQIIINLVVNARDAIPEGREGLITVSTRRERRPDGTDIVVLKVSDTGKGIAPSIRERIFDPFFTTKEPGKGTGLGLSTVYGIMQRYGGDVRVESEVGQGSTFTLIFPVKSVRQEHADGTVQDADGQGCETAHEKGKGFTVLVVDDETTLLEFVAESLEAEGFHVFTAASGEQALELLEKEGASINAVVLDFNMPGMGGGACYEEIRRRYPSISVVVTSGYTGASIMENLGKSRNVSVLSKPYRIADLLSALASCRNAFVPTPAATQS